MKLLYALAAAFAVVAGTANASEADTPELGPAVGAEIPHDLSATAHDGAAQSFETLRGDRGLALFFVRSVDWCPFCQIQVMDVDRRAAEFEERGLNVVFLSYDTPEEQTQFVDRRKIQSLLLSDTESEIIDAFGLRNENYEEGSNAYGVPHPVVFIVNPDRIIAAKLHEEDYLSNDRSYRNRPAVDLILNAVDEAASAGELASAAQ